MHILSASSNRALVRPVSCLIADILAVPWLRVRVIA